MLDVPFASSSQLSLGGSREVILPSLVILSGRFSITCYGVMAVNGVIEEHISVG
jgi:hypothetical protein